MMTQPVGDKKIEAGVHTKAIEEILGPIEDVNCGMGPIRHRFLQALATPATYIVLSSLMAIIQGIFYTYTFAAISTIEKRYSLSSKLSGFTTTGNDVANILLALPLPFLAGKGHRPRYLAYGMLLSGVGCFLAALPHFVIIPDDPTTFWHEGRSDEYVLCEGDSSNYTLNQCTLPSSSSISTGSIIVIVLLILSQMLCSVGTLLYYTIGHSYMDEAVSKEKVPIYFSFSGAARHLGPVCSYSLAFWTLRMWVYPRLTSSISIKPDHPHWIGAWWVGYIIVGSLLIIFSWPLALMPRTLPATRRRREKEIAHVVKTRLEDLPSYLESLRGKSTSSFKEMFASLHRIFVNPILVLLSVNQALTFLVFMGYLTFKSKYIEQQFHMSAADANKYIAYVSLCAAVAGLLGTGLSFTYFKPKSRTVLVFMMFLTTGSGICYLIQMFIQCEQPEINGLNQVLTKKDSPMYESTSLCEGSTQFSPVCNKETSQIFFSPCQAGCSVRNKFNQSFVYTNCSCIQDIELPTGTKDWALEEGFCPKTCPHFMLYLVVSVIEKFFHSAIRVPVNVILFRCVEERDKDLALGVFNLFVSLAFIVSPIFYGWAIDFSCVLWSKTCNSSFGRCWIYDNDSFRVSVHGISAGLILVAIFANLAMLKYHKTLKLYSDVPDKNQNLNSATQKDEVKEDTL